MAFDRKMELFIGVFKDAAKAYVGTDVKLKQEGYLIDGTDSNGNSLHYEFEITQSTEFYKNAATFTIEPVMDADGYVIRSASGRFIGLASSTSNGMDESTDVPCVAVRNMLSDAITMLRAPSNR